MKRIVAFSLALLIVLSLAGCGSDENRIVGKWYVEGADFEFYFAKDGTGSVFSEGMDHDITWSVSDGTLKVTQAYPYNVLRFQYEFSGSMLVLSYSGEQIPLKRK